MLFSTLILKFFKPRLSFPTVVSIMLLMTGWLEGFTVISDKQTPKRNEPAFSTHLFF